MRTLTVLLLLACAAAFAADKKDPPPVTQEQTAIALSGSAANAESSATSSASSKAGAAAASDAVSSNEGNSLSVNSNHEAGAPDIVLVPNNNTAGCQRVIGLSFANQQGGGGLGYPVRDKACDYEAAADDAAATGDHKLAWHWRCHKPSIYEPYLPERRLPRLFGGHKKHRKASVEACISDMYRMLAADEQSEAALRQAQAEIGRLQAQKQQLLAERRRDYEQCEREKDAIDERCTK